MGTAHTAGALGVDDMEADEMSDCANGGRNVYQRPHETLRMRMEFAGENQPWMYALALNGREIKTLTIDGQRWIPAQNVTDIRDAELMQNIRQHIAQLQDDYEQLWTRYKAVVHENTLISKQQDYARRMRAFESDTEVYNT